mmetsp:Transcript_25853/g.56682  ORF Transcript_25853/g.56682 Transcript_25853/m.56682 type:complete len:274 (-) Transcript_25853:157-978(-)
MPTSTTRSGPPTVPTPVSVAFPLCCPRKNAASVAWWPRRLPTWILAASRRAKRLPLLSEDPRSRQSCRSSRDWSTRSKSWSWGEASPTPLPRPGASRSEPRCARTTWSTLPRRFWRMPKRRASRSSSPSTPSPPSRSPPAPCPGTTRPSLTWSPAVASTTTLWASTSAPRPASSSSRASRRPPRLFSTDPWVSLKSSPLTTAPRPWWTPWRKSPRTGPLPLWAAGTRWRPWRNSEKPMPCPTCPPVGVPPSSSWRATFCPVSWRLPITSRQQG